MEAREATEEEIGAFHDQELVDKMNLLKEAVEGGGERKKEVLNELANTHDSVLFNDGTWNSAHLAAGGSIDAVDKVGMSLSIFVLGH